MGIEILSEARKYTARGWVVHPLSLPEVNNKTPPPNAGKKPLLSDWPVRKQATEAELIRWFEKTENNIGMVCGKESGIIVIDLDKLDWLGALAPAEENLIETTLMAGRTTGRGHVYFKYDPEIKNLKLHALGIEILSDGSNVVLAPSIHHSGEQYKWKKAIDPAKFPKTIKKNISLLKSLDGKAMACRPCVKQIFYASNDLMHGTEGRRLMLMVSTELKAQDVTEQEMLLYARKVYGDKFDGDRTKREYKNCDASKTWKCDTIRSEFSAIANMCANCPIKQLDKDYIDVETKEKAIEIMQTGNTIDYILQTWNRIHVGDISFGFVLMCSAMSGSIKNSDGIQINFNGDSGGGKSHACRTMLHLMPKKYWSKKSLSNKALFYSDSIRDGMILFSDDVILSDDLKTIYKNSVSDFQEEIEHETVDIRREAVTLRVASRLSWWLTAVSDPGNEEIERRNLKIVIDVNKERSKSIAERLYLRKSGCEAKYPDYPEVFICRAIFDNLKSNPESVVIPYKIRFKDGISLDTQNIIYELVYSTTLLNKYKREKTPDGEIISTPDDFKLVITHFSKISDTQISKLTKGELQVALFMRQQGAYSPVTSDLLQEKFGRSKGWVSQIFNGKNGDGGLLQKLANIVEDDITKKDDVETVRKKEYRFVGNWDELSIYDSVAEIEP